VNHCTGNRARRINGESRRCGAAEMAINLRLTNIPPVTKATLVASFLLSLLCAALRYRVFATSTAPSPDAITEEQLAVPFLTLIPSTSWIFPWTFLTASFVHGNILSVQSLKRSAVDWDRWRWAWLCCCMQGDILNGRGRRKNMPSFYFFVRLGRI
jgi:hypothetical protein